MMRRTTLLCLKLRLVLSIDGQIIIFNRLGRMALAMEINVVIWLMIGCATAETVQLVEHLY